MWEWVDSYRSHRDVERRHLPELFDQGFPMRETTPQQALKLFEKGRRLAESLHELCWILFFDYWRCQIYVFYLRDLNRARDLAIRMTVEASKPVYAACPLVAQVYGMLLDVYNYLDPIGYADRINEIVTFIENKMHLDPTTQYRLIDSKAHFCHVMGDLDEQIRFIHQNMANVERNDFKKTHCHLCLCYVYYYRGELVTAHQHAVEGEFCARRSNRQEELATMLAWQAVYARHEKDEHSANQLYRQAVLLMDTLGCPPMLDYSAALANYHEVGGETDLALKVRQQELEQMLAFGSPHYETETRLCICRLLGRMGKPFDEELVGAHKSAEKLLNPARFHQKVERILNGDYSDRLD